MSRPDPGALARRLDAALDEAERLIRDVDEASMSGPASAEASVRDTAFRIFRLGLGFADGMDLGRFPEAWRRETAPEDLRDGASVARYGALVRGRLSGWLEGATPREFTRIISGDDGPQSGHELLERVAADAEGHLRVLRAALARAGRAR